MPRSHHSGRIDLAEAFRRMQLEMLAEITVGGLLEHPTAMGTATEQCWQSMLKRYLPRRYRASPAFVIDSNGVKSRQIDIAIFDDHHHPQLFPHEAGVHVPAESVYAVFEVKPTISRQWMRDAHEKAASVQSLHRTSPHSQPILSGLLATSSVWCEETFAHNLQKAMPAYPLDLGCSLAHGAFERTDHVTVSLPEEALFFFILRLLHRLNAMGPAPPIDLMQYGRSLRTIYPVRARP